MGTIDGEPALKGTCFEKTFVPMALPILTYDGVAAYAAMKHGAYMSGFGYDTNAHYERDAQHPAFYGASIRDRLSRAQTELVGKPINAGVGENVGGGQYDAVMMVTDWAQSQGHCENMTNPKYQTMGPAVFVNEAMTVNGIFLPSGLRSFKRSWVQMLIYYP